MSFQMPHTIKAEPYPKESPLSSFSHNTSESPFPSISEWYNDGRSSTSSVASSRTIFSDGPAPVFGYHSRHEHVSSPYRLPLGPDVVQKSIAKAKARSVRGVAHTSNASNKDLPREEKEPIKAKANGSGGHVVQNYKARRKNRSVAYNLRLRSCLSASFTAGWQELLNTNANFVREGMLKDGKKGLTRLKSNNIDKRIEGANEVNKDQVLDLLRICHRQFREITVRQIENHCQRGRYVEASELERELRGVGTHL